MKKIIKVMDFIVSAGGYVAGFLCLVLVAVVVLGVFSRYILKAPLDWTMEISQYLFCGISLLATGYALLEGAHVRIDLVRIRLSLKVQERLDLVQYAIVVCLCIVLIWMGGQEFWNTFVNNHRSESVLGLLLWPVWSTIPLGGVLLLLAAISGICKFFFNIENNS